MACFLGFALFFSSPVKAEELVIGYDDFPPLTIKRNGIAQGPLIDLIREACLRMGHTAVFVNRPFARLLMDAEMGRVDAMTSAFWAKDRAKYLYYPSQSPIVDEILVYSRKEANKSYQSLEDLKGSNLGAVRGYFYGEGVLEALEGHVEFVKDSDTLYRMLGEGRFESILSYKLSGGYQLKRLNIEDDVHVSLVFKTLPYYTVFSKKLGQRGQELAESLTQQMVEIMNERQAVQ